MATGTIILPIPPSALDGTNPPPMRFEDHRWEMVLDDTTVQPFFWTWRMPENYASAPVLKVQFKATAAVTGDFGIDVAIFAVSSGDSEDVDVPTFATDNVSAGVTVPDTTAGKLGEVSLALSNDDGLAAGDLISLRLNRNTSVASDATGDIEVVAVSLEYTTT